VPIFDSFIVSRDNLTPASVKKYEAARGKLVEWSEVFQPTTDIRTITQAQTDRWVAKLRESSIAAASVRGFCHDVKTVFRESSGPRPDPKVPVPASHQRIDRVSPSSLCVTFDRIGISRPVRVALMSRPVRPHLSDGPASPIRDLHVNVSRRQLGPGRGDRQKSKDQTVSRQA
jgi:hypothetical protein